MIQCISIVVFIELVQGCLFCYSSEFFVDIYSFQHNKYPELFGKKNDFPARENIKRPLTSVIKRFNLDQKEAGGLLQKIEKKNLSKFKAQNEKHERKFIIDLNIYTFSCAPFL